MSLYDLKSVQDYGDYSLNNILRESLLYFFNWSFLNIGAFQNVQLSSSGAIGYDNSKLYNITGPSYYTAGKYWQTNRQNYVWESGVSYNGQTPINISGVYVNGTFQPSTGVGAFAHTIDYINGQVKFTTAISPSSVVRMEYPYKRVKFTTVDDVEFKKLQEKSLLHNDTNFTLGSGDNQQLSPYRVQTPLVAIQPVPRRNYPNGIELGGGTYLQQDVLFHVYADTSTERDKLFDIISNQYNKAINLVNINKLAENNAFPINTYGNIVNQLTRNYENMAGPTSQYAWRQCVFDKVIGQEQTSLNSSIFGATVRVTMKIPMSDI